jgi:uncharacterized protein (UPF0335 family)
MARAEKKAAKKRATKKDDQPPQQPNLSAAPDEQPQKLKVGKNSVPPETKKKFYDQARLKQAAVTAKAEELSSLRGELQNVYKNAKAAGVNTTAIKEVLKMKKEEPEQLQVDLEAINEMMVLAGLAVPVKPVNDEITSYSIQIGLFDNKNVARHIEDKAWQDSAPKAAPEPTQVEIARAKATGTVAADKGIPSDKNPYLKSTGDPGHPLTLAWEGARADRMKDRVGKELKDGAPAAETVKH